MVVVPNPSAWTGKTPFSTIPLVLRSSRKLNEDLDHTVGKSLVTEQANKCQQSQSSRKYNFYMHLVLFNPKCTQMGGLIDNVHVGLRYVFTRGVKQSLVHMKLVNNAHVLLAALDRHERFSKALLHLNSQLPSSRTLYSESVQKYWLAVLSFLLQRRQRDEPTCTTALHKVFALRTGCTPLWCQISYRHITFSHLNNMKGT